MEAAESDAPHVPQIDPSKLRSAALLQVVDDWIHQHYVPVVAEDGEVPEEASDASILSTMEVLERGFGSVLDAGNLAQIGHSLDKASLNWVRRSGEARPSGQAEATQSVLALDDDARTGGREPVEIVLAARRQMLLALD